LAILSFPHLRVFSEAPERGRATPRVIEMCKIDGDVDQAMLGVELDMYLRRRRDAIETI
jgi:hypothetical protein